MFAIMVIVFKKKKNSEKLQKATESFHHASEITVGSEETLESRHFPTSPGIAKAREAEETAMAAARASVIDILSKNVNKTEKCQ